MFVQPIDYALAIWFAFAALSTLYRNTCMREFESGRPRTVALLVGTPTPKARRP